MNVLITTPSLDVGKNVSGISSVVREIMKTNTIRFFPFVLGKSDAQGYNIKWLLCQLSIPFRFVLCYFKLRFKVVHLNTPLNHFGVLRDGVVFFMCKCLNVKIISHIHGGVFMREKPKNGILSFLIKQIMNRADALIVLSEVEKRVLQELYAIKKAINVLPNCVDTDALRPNISRQMTEELEVLFLGRIEINKGVLDIIAGFEILKKNGELEGISFKLCGTGPMLEKMKEEMSAILGDKFQYCGIVSGAGKDAIINNSDIFLLPSKFEGLPMALLETMSAGVVPIVTNVGSISTVVKDNMNGLIIKSSDADDIAKKLVALNTNRSAFLELSSNARATIVENFDLSKFHDKLSNIYTSI